jgi:hypothetical protein
MTTDDSIHAVATYWNSGERKVVGSYQTGGEAKAAVKAWVADKPEVQEVFIFAGTTPLFSVHGLDWVRDCRPA